MKTRHARKRETNTVATVAHNKHCENVQDLLFVVIPNISMIFFTGNLYFCMNSLIGPVTVGLIGLIVTPFACCVNLCSNSSLAVGKIGLNIPLVRTRISRRGNTPHSIERQASKERHVVFMV